jgi:hypothetical protein
VRIDDNRLDARTYPLARESNTLGDQSDPAPELSCMAYEESGIRLQSNLADWQEQRIYSK